MRFPLLLSTLLVATAALRSLAAPGDGDAVVSKLLEGLESDKDRPAAMTALAKLGEKVLPALRKVYWNGEPQARKPAADLIAQIEAKRITPAKRLEGHQDGATCVAFLPDGRQLISGGRDKTARLWDTRTGKLVQTFAGHEHSVLCLAVTADGKHLLTGSYDGFVRLWLVEIGKAVSSLKAGKAVYAVAFADKDRTLVAVGGDVYFEHSQDFFDGRLYRWDRASGASLLSSETGTYGVAYPALNSDGTLAAVGGPAAVGLFETTKGKATRSLLPQKDGVIDHWSLAVSPDGKRLLAWHNGGALQLVDAGNGKLLADFGNHAGTINSLSFTTDGKFAVSAGSDKALRLWDLDAGVERVTFGAPTPLMAAAISTDQRRVAAAGTDGFVYVWDVPAKK